MNSNKISFIVLLLSYIYFFWKIFSALIKFSLSERKLIKYFVGKYSSDVKSLLGLEADFKKVLSNLRYKQILNVHFINSDRNDKEFQKLRLEMIRNSINYLRVLPRSMLFCALIMVVVLSCLPNLSEQLTRSCYVGLFLSALLFLQVIWFDLKIKKIVEVSRVKV